MVSLTAVFFQLCINDMHPNLTFVLTKNVTIMTRSKSKKEEGSSVEAPKTSSMVNEHGFDFSNMGFDWVTTNSFIKYIWKEGVGWDAGELVRGTDHISIHVSGMVFPCLFLVVCLSLKRAGRGHGVPEHQKKEGVT